MSELDRQLLWQHGNQYNGESIDPDTAAPDPFIQFRTWFGAAEARQLPTVNAMSLATVTSDGWPAVRIVLLKEIDQRGLVFFTNYQSAKGEELGTHPRAALALYWEPLHRQIRVVGAVEKVSEAESDAYFAVRPFVSQLGAIASPQSRPVERSVLQARIDELEREHGGTAPTRPPWWGGYRVVPHSFEFWQGQPNRLHDRVRYRRDATQGWLRDRLAP
ncbi:MAG: pyridoxamine 5'-phosphate oxidase [Kofleriaceae bacterium]|nr:pyridoxamine 5'-phosphate oxidase [Kofleriaceae bacterium]